MAVYEDVLGGLLEDQGTKAPAAVATTADMTNSMTGLQTIDGYALQINDRVLVWKNANETTNGVYEAQTGAWGRTVDFSNGGAVAAGTMVFVFHGTQFGGATFACQVGNPTFGSTPITFKLVSWRRACAAGE
jgi:hypothetical protein